MPTSGAPGPARPRRSPGSRGSGGGVGLWRSGPAERLRDAAYALTPASWLAAHPATAVRLRPGNPPGLIRAAQYAPVPMSAPAPQSRSVPAPGPVPPTRARHVMLGFTLAAMAVAYLDRVCISTAAPAIKARPRPLRRADGLRLQRLHARVRALRGAERLARGPLRRAQHADAHRALVVGDDRGDRPPPPASTRSSRSAGSSGWARRACSRAWRARTRAGCRFGERGRAFGLTIMAAALGGAATQPLVVALLERMSWRARVPDLRRGRRRLGGGVVARGSATTRASTAA